MMRSKEEMLRESLDAQAKEPAWDTAMSKHEQLIIEVLIDIRDAIITDVKDLLNALIEIRKTH